MIYNNSININAEIPKTINLLLIYVCIFIDFYIVIIVDDIANNIIISVMSDIKRIITVVH